VAFDFYLRWWRASSFSRVLFVVIGALVFFVPAPTRARSRVPLAIASAQAQVQDRPQAVNPGVRITSPLPGQRFAPGDTLTVNVQVDTSLNATDVLLGISGMDFTGTTRLDLVNYQARVAIPATFSGPATIGAVALDANSHEFPSAPITISVSPLVAPVQVAFVERYYYIDPSVESEQLSLTGTYADKIQRDLTTSDTGTIYSTNNPAVVRVGADGFAQVKGIGIAVITPVNGRARDFAIFVVEKAASPGGLVLFPRR